MNPFPAYENVLQNYPLCISKKKYVSYVRAFLVLSIFFFILLRLRLLKSSQHRMYVHYDMLIGSKGGAANFCLQKSRIPIGRIGIFNLDFAGEAVRECERITESWDCLNT